MAVTGGSSAATQFRLEDGALKEVHRTVAKSICQKPEDAVLSVAAGNSVWVMGSNVVKFRELWKKRNE